MGLFRNLFDHQHNYSLLVGSLLASAFSVYYAFRRKERQLVPYATYNVFAVVKGMTSLHPYLYMHRLAKQCGRQSYRLALPIFVVWEFHVGSFRFRLPLPMIKKVFVVGDASLCRRILQEYGSDKPIEIYSSFEQITKSPIMFTSMTSSYTKIIRSLAHRSFSSQQSRMQRVAQHYIEQWVDGRLGDFSKRDEAFEPTEEALAITFFVICDFAFEYKASHDEYLAFVQSMDVALHEFAYRQTTNPLRKMFGWILPSTWKAEKAAKWVREFSERVLTSFQAQPLEIQHGGSFLAMMAQTKELNDPRMLLSEIIMFLFAGHDTSGASLSNTMVLLARDSGVQEKLRDELKAANGNRKAAPFYDNVIREINRYFPVAVMGATRLTRSDFLLDDGLVLPRDSICLMPHYLLYRDPAIFRNPDEFDPDRWDNCTKEMNEANFPFSLGPRNCPGKPVALEVMHQFLPRLLARYSLTMEQDGRPDYLVVQKHIGCRLKAYALEKE